MSRTGKGRFITVLILTLFYFSAVIIWENRYEKRKRSELIDHCSVISDALWKLDDKTAARYLDLAAQYGYYHEYTLWLLPEEDVFISRNCSCPPPVYRFYRRFGFMKELILTSPVLYDSREIGRLQISLYNTSVYAYTLFLFPFLLLGTLIGSGVRSFYYRKDLEDRVRRRTREYRTSEKRYRTLVQNIPGISYRCFPDAGRSVDYISEEVERLTGYPPRAFSGEGGISLNALVSAEDRERVSSSLMEAKEKGGPFMLEYAIKDRNGSTHWVYDRGRVIAGEYGSPGTVEGVIMDITERHVMEEQYRQAQKMESVGRLAGGIAHDINNMLTPVMGYADLLLAENRENEDVGTYAREILKASQRARELIEKLLTYSRRKPIEYEPVDVNRVIRQFHSFLRGMIREEIDLEMELKAHGGTIIGDRNQLEQAVLNLVINSQDAIEGPGRILLETEIREWEDIESPEKQDKARGSYVLILVKDDGKGMDGETIGHLWEPFFSTKGTMGTGLGMSTVFGIVEQHKGFLSVKSEVGRGCEIGIFLPRESEI